MTAAQTAQTQPAPQDLQDTRTRLTIDLGAIVENWKTIAARVAPAECSAVVKANAYGLGIGQVAPALWLAGARTFFVAHLAEAITLRALLPEAVIYVLNGLPPGTTAQFATHQLRPVLGSLPEIGEWSSLCRSMKADLPAALHVDTGMNRLGLSLEEAAHIAQEREGLRFTPSLIMTHLACADTPDHPLTPIQRDRFFAVTRLFPDVRASLANSAGTQLDASYHMDLVRPGILLYGGRAIEHAPPLRPVVRLEAPVIQVRHAKAGESVGYGATEHLRRDSRLAILHIGYADGLFRAAGSTDARKGAQVIIADQRCPLVGRISMDLCAVDITDLPEDAVARGMGAIFLGACIDVDELAQKAGTISYEVLTSLGARYQRHYLAP